MAGLEEYGNRVWGRGTNRRIRVPISVLAGVYPSGPECPPVWGESSEVAAARLVSRRWRPPKAARDVRDVLVGPCILRSTRLASTSVSSGCSQHAREQHGLWPRHIASFQRLGCRNDRGKLRDSGPRGAFECGRAQGAPLPHRGDHAGRVSRGWRSSWEFPTEKTRAACGTWPLGWGSTRALQSVRAWQQVLAIVWGPLQAFTTLVQSMVRVFKLEPKPWKAHVLSEIADGIYYIWHLSIHF